MCVRYTITRHQQHIYIILVVGPAQIAMLGLKPNIRDGHKCTAHYFLFAHVFLFSQKVGAQFFSNFSMGNNAYTEGLLTKKRFYMRFRYKHLRMKRFPLRNNFKKKKKISWNITSTRSQLIPLEVGMFWSINWKNYLGHQIQEDFWVIITNH